MGVAEASFIAPRGAFAGAGDASTASACWEVMGHESLSTTMGYLHPETAEIKVVIDRLNQQKQGMSQQPQKQPQLQES